MKFKYNQDVTKDAEGQACSNTGLGNERISKKNVYVIVSKRSQTYGHGDFGDAYHLAMTGSYDSPPPHPAFESRGAADEYIAGLQWKHGLSVMELELMLSAY